MLKKYFSLLVVFIFLIPVSISQAALVIPPLPMLSPQNTTAIVTLDNNISVGEIHEILTKYPSLKLRRVYKHAISGFSVSGSMTEMNRLKNEAKNMTVTQVSIYHALLEESVPFIGADSARSFFDEKKRRITGKGVKVGIIDTGIDYTHPDLRNSYKGGRDLVDDDNDPMETKGMSDLSTIHGTHVAGIIAANGKMKGVAPEAEIIAYRALGPGGVGDTEQVLAAIDAAIEDKVDVLNLSLGNNVNGPDLPISIALNKAVDSGIVAVTSNGNAGPAVWTVGSPGTAEKAISVGASTPPMKVPYLVWGLGKEKKQISLQPLQGSKSLNINFSQDIVNGGLGLKDELKQAKGKVVLIERGVIAFTEKVANAEKAGAKAVIIFNNTAGKLNGGIEGTFKIPAVSLSKKDGEKIKKNILAKKKMTITFIYKKEQDQLADFSSRGPVTVTWDIKPDILAPGVAIDSTVPSGYSSMQGTSMAAPHVAGACALILQAHPNWTPNQVKSAIMSTALPLKNKKGDLYRTYEQGAGRLQIEQALKADTLLSRSSLSFGMFTKKEGVNVHEERVMLENTGKEKKTYSFEIPNKEKGITWNLPSSFTVYPGEKKELVIGLQVNPSKMKKGIFDGYINLFEGASRISLPFLYVKEEPNYPRVMGFEFGLGDQKGSYRYEVYLPRGADEFGVVLYDIDSLRFAGYMDWAVNISQGIVKKELTNSEIPPHGTYKVIIFAKRFGKEDRIETEITIE